MLLSFSMTSRSVFSIPALFRPSKARPAGHGSIPDNSHHVFRSYLPFILVGHCNAQCGGYGGGRMPCSERSRIHFRSSGKAADALVFAVCMKNIAPPGEYLMSVGLVAYIPYKGIRPAYYTHNEWRTVSSITAQAGTEMPRIGRAFVNDKLPEFLTNLRQLFFFQFP